MFTTYTLYGVPVSVLKDGSECLSNVGIYTLVHYSSLTGETPYRLRKLSVGYVTR